MCSSGHINLCNTKYQQKWAAWEQLKYKLKEKKHENVTIFPSIPENQYA